MFAMFLCMCACRVEQNYFSFFLCKSLFLSLFCARARARVRVWSVPSLSGTELSALSPTWRGVKNSTKTLVASFSARPAAPGPGNRWREG